MGQLPPPSLPPYLVGESAFADTQLTLKQLSPRKLLDSSHSSKTVLEDSLVLISLSWRQDTESMAVSEVTTGSAPPSKPPSTITHMLTYIPSPPRCLPLLSLLARGGRMLRYERRVTITRSYLLTGPRRLLRMPTSPKRGLWNTQRRETKRHGLTEETGCPRTGDAGRL